MCSAIVLVSACYGCFGYCCWYYYALLLLLLLLSARSFLVRLLQSFCRCRCYFYFCWAISVIESAHFWILHTLYEWNTYSYRKYTHSHKCGTVLRAIGATGISLTIRVFQRRKNLRVSMYMCKCVCMSIWMSECVLEFGRRTTFTHTTQGWMEWCALTRHAHTLTHAYIFICIHLLCTKHSNATHYFLTLSSL